MEKDKDGKVVAMTAEEIRRNIAYAYHPDRFMDPEMKALAEEIMKDANEMCDQHKGETLRFKGRK